MAIQKEAPNTNVAPPYTLLLSKMKPDSRIKVYTEDTGMFIFFVFHKIPFWERTAKIADIRSDPERDKQNHSFTLSNRQYFSTTNNTISILLL